MIDLAHQPDDAYFARMAQHARTHWWYEGRRQLVAQVLAGRVRAGAVTVDVGCGTGDNLGMLEAVAAGPVTGVELSAAAIGHAPQGPAGTRVAIALAEALPYADDVAQLLTSMDVIEHLDDDAVALAEYRRVLAPGGVLLLTVPAYQWLWSTHDVTAAHRRRYRRSQLTGVVRSAGFTVERCTYFNSFLVPPAAALRRTPLRRLAGENEEVGDTSPFVARIMAGLSRAERRVIARFPVPFGLSILLVASRP